MSVTCESKYNDFHTDQLVEKCIPQNGGHRSFYLGRDVSTQLDSR